MASDYAMQLLPNERAARVIRKALTQFVNSSNVTQVEEDICWQYIAVISQSLNKQPH